MNFITHLNICLGRANPAAASGLKNSRAVSKGAYGFLAGLALPGPACFYSWKSLHCLVYYIPIGFSD